MARSLLALRGGGRLRGRSNKLHDVSYIEFKRAT